MEDTDTSLDTASNTEHQSSDTDPHDRAGLIAARRAEAEKRRAAESRLASLESELSELKAARESEAQARALEEGRAAELLPELQSKVSTYEQKIAEFEAREAARIERLTESNTERLGKLPDDLKALADGLDLPPEAMASYLGKLEARAVDTAPPITGRNKGGSSKKNPVPADKRAKVERDWNRIGGEKGLYPTVEAYWGAMASRYT